MMASSSGATEATLGAVAAGGRAGTGGRARILASLGGNGEADGGTGASNFARTASGGCSRLSTGIGWGAGGGRLSARIGGGAGDGTDSGGGAAGTEGRPATWLRMMSVRPFFPSSAKKPGYAGTCASAGGTCAGGVATGADAGGARGAAGETGLGGLGTGADAGLARGAAATSFTGEAAVTGFAGGAATMGFAGGAAATGFAGGAAATGFSADTATTGFAGGVFCLGSDFAADTGLGNPAGMAKLGGAARPTMVFPKVKPSSDFPVMGQVRVSGRCCFWQ